MYKTMKFFAFILKNIFSGFVVLLLIVTFPIWIIPFLVFHYGDRTCKRDFEHKI